MSLDLIVLATIAAMFFVLMAIEALAPSRRTLPAVKGWRLMGVGVLVLVLLFNVYAPLLILPLIGQAGVVDLSGWGLWATLPTMLLTTFFTYWSHRTQHYFDPLWRMGHQLHHAVVRVDIASAYLFHPVDLFIQIFWSLLAAILLGVSAEAGALAGVLLSFAAFYQHWNIDTPRWTNWFFQRPEAHMLHHEFDVHARNFGDMPAWDMMFGTYHNPSRADDVRTGFEPQRSRRWLAMLLMVDVNRAEGPAKGREAL